jgi:hypothetical protein
MVLLVLIGLVSAVIGASMRPRLLAVLLATVVAGGLRGLVGVASFLAVDSIHSPVWAQMALSSTESTLADFRLLVAIGFGAATLGALVASFTRRRVRAGDGPRPVRKGRYARAPEMIEDRPQQEAAEQRQKALLEL